MFKILEEITPALEWHGEDFAISCFDYFLNFDSKTVFSSVLVHNLLAREITFDGAGDDELWFGIGQRRLRFSKYEFCLLIELKFKRTCHVPTWRVDTWQPPYVLDWVPISWDSTKNLQDDILACLKYKIPNQPTDRAKLRKILLILGILLKIR